MDAIYITSDNIVVSAFESVVKVCNENDIPLFAGDTGSVSRGAIAAYGLEYFQVGYTAGKKAAIILKGEKKAGEIPSGKVEKLSLFISPKNAEAQGVTIDQKYIDQADKVVE